MTPLAYRITKELTLPLKDRRFNDCAGLLQCMDDIHCFECSEVLGLAKELGDQALSSGVDERSTFLPAPKTWVEFAEDGERLGLLLVEKDIGAYKTASVFVADRNGSGAVTSFVMLGAAARPIGALGDKRMDALIYGLLAFINTPRIVGRRQHMPHRGLERDLRRALGLQGKFPLHAWTEILLHVAPPKDASDEPSVEAHYTGKRALHFCRAHLRIKLGRLELVKAHWRGDSSLGIKRSRYVVAP